MDYLGFKQIKINADILRKISLINKLKTDLERIVYPLGTQVMFETALFNDCEASNELSGINITYNRLISLATKKGKPVTAKDEQIIGLYEANKRVRNSYDYLEIGCRDILLMHRYIYLHNYEIAKGKQKLEFTDVLVDSIDEQGNKELKIKSFVKLEPTKKLAELCKQYHLAIKDQYFNPLILIPCFFIDFINIKPFSRGNGRISRLILNWFLLKAGYLVPKFISINTFFYYDQANFLKAVEDSSKGWENNENDYEHFLNYFIDIILKAYNEAHAKLYLYRNSKLKSTELVYQMISSSYIPLTRKELVTFCTRVSLRTIERAVAELLLDDRIAQIGEGHNLRYYAKDNPMIK